MSRRFALAFDWRNSAPHRLFLLTFRDWRPAADHPVLPEGSDWAMLLEEPPEQAIERFLAHGVLVKADLYERLKYHLKVAQLRQLLKEHDKSVSGNRDELIQRLMQQVEHHHLYAALPAVELLRWSDYGRALAEQWSADPQTVTHLSDHKIVKTAVKVLTWLLVTTAGEVIGSAVYDLLKGLDEPAARHIKGRLPRLGTLKETYVTPTLKLEWCYVPAGYFLMGSAENDPDAFDDEKSQHRVYVPAFYLGKYPITNRQYQVFVQATGHRAPVHWKDTRFPAGQADHPVRLVNWSDAVAFCRWAARASGAPIRLPTEAEWEKGARGEKGYRYPWGNEWRTGYSNSDNKGGQTTPVGQYLRGVSPYGAYDMIGNVWEWTSTLYGFYPYRADDGRENMSITGKLRVLRVLRGGGLYSGPQDSRAAARLGHRDCDDWTYGFRVGWSAPSSSH